MAREHIGAKARVSDAAFEFVSRIAGVGGITSRIEVVTPGLVG